RRSSDLPAGRCRSSFGASRGRFAELFGRDRALVPSRGRHRPAGRSRGGRRRRGRELALAGFEYPDRGGCRLEDRLFGTRIPIGHGELVGCAWVAIRFVACFGVPIAVVE